MLQVSCDAPAAEMNGFFSSLKGKKLEILNILPILYVPQPGAFWEIELWLFSTWQGGG